MGTTTLEQLKDLNSCEVCGRVMCRPVFFPACGHSPVCQNCAIVTKPVKNCPRCGKANKTPAARLPVNLTLGALLRALWPQEFGNRPTDDALLYEIQRKGAIEKLDSAIERAGQEGCYYARLPHDYREKALQLIEAEHTSSSKQAKTHILRWCACGLVELPKRARSGRCFFGCPAWTPFSKKRKRISEDGIAHGEADSAILEPGDLKYCSDYANLSKKQVEVLGL